MKLRHLFSFFEPPNDDLVTEESMVDGCFFALSGLLDCVMKSMAPVAISELCRSLQT